MKFIKRQPSSNIIDEADFPIIEPQQIPVEPISNFIAEPDEVARVTSSFCIDRAIEAVQNAVHSAEYDNHCAIDRARLWAKISQAWTAIATSGKP